MAELTGNEHLALLRNRLYWLNRMVSQQNRITDKSIADIEKQIAKYYASSFKRVIRDFEATLDHLIATVGADKEITPADLYKLEKYWQMQGQLKQELQKLGDKSVNLLQKRFVAQFKNVYDSLDLPITTATFNTIDDAAAMHIVNAVWCADGTNWSQRVWKNTENLAETLNGTLSQCIVSGKKPSAMKEKLKRMVRDDFTATHYAADRLVRTECAHIQTQAARQRYQDAGITQMEVYVDEDERTCPICAKHEGKRVTINETMPVPFHPNCRCCMIPVIESVEPSKEVVQDMKQNKEYQEQIQKRRAAYHQRNTAKQQEQATNKFGQEIEFEQEMLKRPIFEKSVKRIKKLANEYDTRIVKVERGGMFGGGQFDPMTGVLQLATTDEHVAIHEFGHSIATERIHKLKIEDQTAFWKEIKSIRRRYEKSIKRDDGSLILDKMISSYSYANNNDEFIAEAFTHAKIKELGLEMPKDKRGANKYGNDYTYSDEVLAAINKYFKKKKVNK